MSFPHGFPYGNGGYPSYAMPTSAMPSSSYAAPQMSHAALALPAASPKVYCDRNGMSVMEVIRMTCNAFCIFLPVSAQLSQIVSVTLRLNIVALCHVLCCVL